MDLLNIVDSGLAIIIQVGKQIDFIEQHTSALFEREHGVNEAEGVPLHQERFLPEQPPQPLPQPHVPAHDLVLVKLVFAGVCALAHGLQEEADFPGVFVHVGEHLGDSGVVEWVRGLPTTELSCKNLRKTSLELLRIKLLAEFLRRDIELFLEDFESLDLELGKEGLGGGG